jgi:hypothetical protein
VACCCSSFQVCVVPIVISVFLLPNGTRILCVSIITDFEGLRWDRPRDGRWVGQAFRPGGGKQTVNEWGTNKRMQTVDGGRQAAVGQAFQPGGGGIPSTNQGTNKRMQDRGMDGRLQTADRRRTGFPACQGESKPSTNGGTNKRMRERRPRTADGGRTASP